MYLPSFFPFVLWVSAVSVSVEGFEQDVYTTTKGELRITFIGHGTLMFEFDGKVIHVDPVSRYADYSKMPKANLILVTHDHGDHLDKAVIQTLLKEDTDLVLTEKCQQKTGIQNAIIMRNGTIRTLQGIKIEAIPAYNIKHMRSEGVPFHPKGDGNSYVITFGDKRVLVAGDTENTPEMKALRQIDIAFLPMNLPYTMTPEMVADAARAFRPKILYPYHFGNTDPLELVQLLEDQSEIKVLVRKMN
jgi:L-ascorbate metabolism protein UlaG (beta-lactamase superfamily)